MAGASTMSEFIRVAGTAAATGRSRRSWGSRCLHYIWGCRVHGCSATAGWGTRVAGATEAGGTGVVGPSLSLLPSSLWPWVPLQPRSQSCVCCLHFCYSVLWACSLSCCSWGARITGIAATVPQFCFLYVFQSTHLQVHKCVDLSASWCAGQRNLCSVMDVLVVVD